MRKRRVITQTSEAGFSLESAQKLIADLEFRIRQLETEVYGMSLAAPPPPVKPALGRRPGLGKEELLKRRNHLVTWLEQNWPYLMVALPQAENSTEALVAVQHAKQRIQGVFQPSFYHHPEQFEGQIWSFIKSKRFRGNPRNLAAAMAGLPELSWKRSFDICSAHPLKGVVVLEALWDYMRRNFSKRLRELSEVHTPEQVRLVLSRSRTHDPVYLHLKENPDKALEWLNAGKPVNNRRIQT